MPERHTFHFPTAPSKDVYNNLRTAGSSGSIIAMVNRDERNDEEMDDAQGTDSKHYELGFLLVSAIAEENLASEAATIREAIEKHGVIVSGAAPMEKQLSYEMRKRSGGKNMRFRKAYFGHFIFQASADGMAEIREAIKKNDRVLRFLLIARTKESLVAPTRRIPRAPEMRPKRIEEKGAPIDEVAIDKEIEKMVAAAE